MKRMGINYKTDYLKAFWTYKLNDIEFDKEINELNKINTIIMNSMISDGWEIFEKDPFEMTKEKFIVYYARLKAKYLGSNSAFIQSGMMMEESEDLK